MSVLDSYVPIEIEEFHGADSLRNPSDVEPPWALVSQNVEYVPGSVQSRRGFYGTNSGIPSGSPKRVLTHAIGNKSIHYYKDGTTFTRAEDNGAAVTYGLPTNTDGTNDGNLMADFGNRVALAGKVLAYFQEDTLTPALAMPPPKYPAEITLGVVGSAGGLTTPGLHYFAIVLETAYGHRTLPSPWIPSVAGDRHAKTGFSFTVVAGSQTMAITWTLASGAWAPFVKAHLLMTTVANPYRYHYTGVAVALAGGAPAVFNGVSVADGILAQQTDDSFEQSLMVQDASLGAAAEEKFPLDCSGVFATQQRMCYFAGGGVFISEEGLPESVSRDRHFRRLPKGETPLNGFLLQGTIYFSGPQFTYADTDTGGVPVTWPPTRIVDDSIGICHPNAVAVNESGFAFVGHYNGLYVFDGSAYSRRPLSWHQTGLWKKIQWPSTATPWPTFSMVDLPGERMVIVVAVVDGAPTILTWDYTDGLDPERVKFSQWSLGAALSAGTPLYAFRPVNFGDAHQTVVSPQLWLLTSGATKMWKRKPKAHSASYLDEQAGATATPAAVYKTGYLGATAQGGVNGFHGVRLRAEGVGNLIVTAYALDDLRARVMQAIPLSAAPGRFYDRLFSLRSEGCAIELAISTAIPGNYLSISKLSLAAAEFATRRPGVALP